jgi:hypothetical protein
MEGWRHPHLFHGYAVPAELSIPGNGQSKWAFTLIPGWRELVSAPLEEVCAWQWIRCNEAVLSHRDENPSIHLTIRYEDLVKSPRSTLGEIADFLSLDPAELTRLGTRLPQVNVLSKPEPEKWRRQNPEAIQRISPLIQPMMARLRYAPQTSSTADS